MAKEKKPEIREDDSITYQVNIVLNDVDSLVFEHTDSDNMYYVHKDSKVEFFMDEHGFQWVKFIPSNGMHAGQQTCVPRERIIAVVFKHKKLPMAPKLEDMPEDPL